MSRKIEILPCPFCGQSDAFVEQLDSDASVVICQGIVGEHSACLARGPVGVQDGDNEDQPGRDAAIREWNLRAAPVVERQEPVAWRGCNADGEVVTDWIDGVPPELMTDLCGNTSSFDKIEMAYTSPPAPVAVVLPEHKKLPELMMATYHEAKGWNACLDKVKELNQ
jgi:hypothetical protein